MNFLRYAAACTATLSVSLPALATQSDNRGMHAVPAPNHVVIDGKLDEWDTSGEILVCYDLENLQSVYSAKVSLMHDAENLYLALRWTDLTPMGNSHDPRFSASRGWAGDAVQLRFKTDRISHITAWYYAAKQEPGFTVAYGKDLSTAFGGENLQLFKTRGNEMERGVEMAFQKNADGKGYVQEIKIPWKLITLNNKPAVGSQFRLGLDVLWGEADWPAHRYSDNLADGATSREFFWTGHNYWGPVHLEAKGKLKLPEPAYMVAYRRAQEAEAPQGPVDIKYNLPRDARVTVAINDEKGRRVRNLIASLPRKKGANLEKWDGLDDAGKPVQPGKYSFKVLHHQGIHTTYVMSFANPGAPPWKTPNNRGGYYSDHTPPHAVATGGNYVGLACPMGEAGQPLVGTDLEGQRIWGQPNRVFFGDGITSLATDGKILWIANDGKKPLVYRVQIANGEYAPWNLKAKDENGREYNVLELPVAEADDTKKVHYDNIAERNLTSLALRDGVLAVSLQLEHKIKLLDANTGELKRTVNIPAPLSAAFDTDGSLLVLTEGKIVRVKADGGTESFNNQSFADAYGLALDAQRNVYLSVRGTEHNVKVFSPQGSLLREIGVRGGRPHHGAYIEGGMRNPSQIAVDSKNRLWVTEATMNPKRTSVWDVQTGKLIKELVGTTTYAGSGAINPDDPTMGLADDTVYKINLQTGDWKPVYSVGRSGDPAEAFPPGVQDITSRVFNRNGYTYTWSRKGICVLYDGKQWRSAARVGTVVRNKDRGNELSHHPIFDGHEGQSFSWSDANGDGLAQKDEIKFANIMVEGKPAVLSSYYWGTIPSLDGTITYAAKGTRTLVQFLVTGYGPSGAPVYDVNKPRLIQLDDPSLKVGEGFGMIITGDEGRVYLNQMPLTIVEPNGRVAATYPSNHLSVHGSHKASAPRPGYLIGPSSFLGTAQVPGVGEVGYLNGNLGQNYLFTEDGMWIQSLFKDTRGDFAVPLTADRGRNMDDTTAGGESFGGNFVRTKDGKYYVTLGFTDARVLEVDGLETIKRFGGEFTYSPAQFAQAREMNLARAALANAPKKYKITKLDTIPALDGRLDEWPELMDDAKSLVEIQDNPLKRYSRVQMRYDDQNLYLAYRVFAPRSEMKNAGQDERLLFKTGDAVDLMLGPEKTPANGAGNLRLLMTRKAKQPIAVLNQKVAPGAPESVRFSFSSPARTINFDRVTTVPGVAMASAAISGGYGFEAAIPWKVLGVTPSAGLNLKGDVGVLFADSGGTETVARHYWSNKSTGLVNDVPGEADLTPQMWGTFELG